MRQTLRTKQLPAGHTLTVTSTSNAAGALVLLRSGLDPITLAGIVGAATTTVGPYTTDQYVQASLNEGDVTFTEPARFDMGALNTTVGVHDLYGAGAPTDGVTGAAISEIGFRYTDQTAGKMYVNGGTKASPVWKLVTSAA